MNALHSAQLPDGQSLPIRLFGTQEIVWLYSLTVLSCKPGLSLTRTTSFWEWGETRSQVAQISLKPF